MNSAGAAGMHGQAGGLVDDDETMVPEQGLRRAYRQAY
jgi:hypothetical protein